MNKIPGGLNVIFLCSGLEPGRDGVGDYTRRLAAALIAQGASVTVIALNDRFTDTSVATHQVIDGINVPILRIPSALPDTARYALARDLIAAEEPQWLSLQFVTFGYHVKGLKIGLGKWLSSLSKTAVWHVMIHELWVGMDTGSPVKHMLWGWMQKQLIRSLLKKLNPGVLTTQSALYQLYLKQMGYPAHHLPLFANIAVNSVSPANCTDTEGFVTLVLFGNIHDGAPVAGFVKEVADYGKANQINFGLKVLGHCGPRQAVWISEWQASGLPVNIVGRQPEGRISAELASSAIGISTTPLAITDKSGSFAAMQTHGLPVISVSRPWHPRNAKNLAAPDSVFYYQKGNFNQFYSHLKDLSGPVTAVNAIAQQLAGLLSAFNGKL